MAEPIDPGWKITEPAPPPESLDALPIADPEPNPPGTILAGFQILRILGKGGFARVYLAWQANLQRTVALKVGPDRGTEPQTLAQLDHPSIVRVFDLYQLERTDKCLLSMSFVPGGTLAEVLARVHARPKSEWNGRSFLEAIDQSLATHGIEPSQESITRRQLHDMTWPEVVAWVGARAAEALDYSHRKQVLHRDIKPANILLTADAVPQLADFNVGSSQLKEPGPKAIFGGSIQYMSPEQLEVLDLGTDPKVLDGRCDIYSLGLTLWKMLTGERPFSKEPNTGDLFDKIGKFITIRKQGLPEDAKSLLPANCPAGLVDVLRRSLEGDRENRFATAGEMARNLALCLHPETLKLIAPRPTGWTAWVRRHPLITMMPIGLAPNLIAAILNIRYNQAAVIDARPEAQPTFELLVWWINSFFFSIGLGVFWLAAKSVADAVRALNQGAALSATEVIMARRRCCKIGTVAAMVGVFCWCIAGALWPLALDSLVGWLGWSAHLHFLISLTLCGLIAAVYPFFLVTYLAMHDLMPVLATARPPESNEEADLKRIDRALVPYLVLAAVVPLLGIAALLFVESKDTLTVKILVVVGLIGCGFAFLLERWIRATLRALGPLFTPTSS